MDNKKDFTEQLIEQFSNDEEFEESLYCCPVTQLNGEHWQTSFILDFDCIEHTLDAKCIKKLFDEYFKEFKDEKIFMTELSIVCNLRYHFWKDKDEEFSLQYAKQYVQTRQYVMDNWNDEDREYYFKMTD